MKYPILSPYPIFGQDNYAYLHTLIRYNAVKAGYDSSIYSARFPDYVHAGNIGPQAKVKHQGQYDKYISLILDHSSEILTFQIKVPVRTELKAKIQAVLFPIDDTGLSLPTPVAWSSEEYTKEPNDGKTVFRLNYSTDSGNAAADYFFADVNISNIYDPANPFHSTWCSEAIKVETKDTLDEAKLLEANFLQKIIEPENGVSKTYVLRVFMTVRDKVTNMLMDQRDDSIILDILPSEGLPPAV